MSKFKVITGFTMGGGKKNARPGDTVDLNSTKQRGLIADLLHRGKIAAIGKPAKKAD